MKLHDSPYSIDVWQGVYADYPIPKKFAGLMMSNRGLPDKRQARLQIEEFYSWVAQQEKNALAKLLAMKARSERKNLSCACARAAHNPQSTPTPLGDSNDTNGST